ncbi:hypothetical protein B0H11DRAFT_2216934 [Mycena galericulata]|nr:hypothetical protein B0H11DRAFT_2216934 [Mycena galericulata]
MRDYPPSERLVDSTPGCQGLAVRAWAFLLQGQNLRRRRVELWNVHQYITQGTVCVEDIVEGAGGGIDDVARLIVRQCDLAGMTRDIPISPDNLSLLEIALNLVAKIDNIGMDDEVDLAPSKPLCHALIPLGFVKTLILIGCALSRITVPSSSMITQNCLILLEAIFHLQAGHRELCVAVQNGLLRVILLCAKSPASDSVHNALLNLLSRVLSPATVYYHVLVDLGTACFAIADVVGPEGFSRQDVFEAWRRLMHVVQARLEVLRIFDSADRLSLRACDYVECCNILEKKSLKRCTGCFNVFYCTQKCQILDWHRAHRKSCEWNLSFRTNIFLTYTSREYAFLRALLHHDYASAKSDLHKLMVKEWTTKPDSVFFTLYDYTSHVVNVGIAEVTIVNDDSGFWADIVARASLSSGRMSLDIMRVPEGRGSRDLVIPLRRSTSEVPDALKMIAAGAAAGVDSVEVEQQIESLRLVRSGTMEEFH